MTPWKTETRKPQPVAEQAISSARAGEFTVKIEPDFSGRLGATVIYISPVRNDLFAGFASIEDGQKWARTELPKMLRAAAGELEVAS